ncbi:MAG TPA: YdbL family protein [Allosphingosinicella sp.]|nr:YdbL family protein [Allosphingosinicella sp.]
MTRRAHPILAVAIGLAALAGGAGQAYGMAQADTAAELRATRQVGEQADGYLGLVGEGTPQLRARVNDINIRRRAHYAQVAARRGVHPQAVAATMACEIFATSVLPGQYYRLPDGVWRQRRGAEPVPRPSYCG